MTDLIFLKSSQRQTQRWQHKINSFKCTPGRYATRLDFANLNYIRPDFAEKFLTQLLTQPCFDFKISFDGIDLSSLQYDEQKQLGLLSK